MTRAGQRLNYPGIGATEQEPGEWPAGYRTLRVSDQVGRGDEDFAAAADAVMTWRMHRTAGVRFDTDAKRAVPGAQVVVGLGVGSLRTHAPCRVVWTVERPHRTGWAYGTLPGHPLRGEEAFVVVRDDDGTVRLEVLAFSTPATWVTAAAGPLLRFFQRWYARRTARVLRRIVDEERQALRTAGQGAEPDTDPDMEPDGEPDVEQSGAPDAEPSAGRGDHGKRDAG
ncbi:DUF1990 family protein [Streptomyces marispadix]|uniref:DUF1990 domain-containing protein n=1 Tax=Streptomyces marispadix TaxID=2922868 RepID=A0ABS9SRP6_9ACTN|nr:DUF1990 domain-containing protein [Streptomyces marispadix]MCH6158949.1 DUF1990 domain-containing protein [Streptomyces marispadix]